MIALKKDGIRGHSVQQNQGSHLRSLKMTTFMLAIGLLGCGDRDQPPRKTSATYEQGSDQVLSAETVLPTTNAATVITTPNSTEGASPNVSAPQLELATSELKVFPVEELIADVGIAALELVHELATPDELELPQPPAEPAVDQKTFRRDTPYIAVRGLVQHGKQIKELQQKLVGYEPIASPEYTDCLLERQSYGENPAETSEWTKVNLKVALDVLRKVTVFTADPVSEDRQDAVFTMPLPYQLAGDWIENVNHPHLLASEQPTLLFRYLDFDVQPAMSYRYRAKLQVHDPRAFDPRRGDKRFSAYRDAPWSDATPWLKMTVPSVE